MPIGAGGLRLQGGAWAVLDFFLLHTHIPRPMDRGASTIIATIADDAAGWRLDRALAATLPTISRERLKVLISSGQVRDAEGVAVRDPAPKAQTGTAQQIPKDRKSSGEGKGG